MITVDYLKQQRHRQATAYIFFLFQQQKKHYKPQISQETERKNIDYTIIFHRRTEIALKTLTPDDRNIIMTFINQLKASPTKLLTSGQVHKASEQEHLYIIKVSDFIIPFILNGNQIEIQDIYKNERLKHIF